jgi:hypothetical protein
LSTYEKEYMTILAVVDQWRHYLQFGEFHIFTDQKSLVQLAEQRLHTHWQQKVFTNLLGLQYKIIYKKGEDNKTADALSRRRSSEAQCLAVTSGTPQWVQLVTKSYEKDAHAQQLLIKLVVDKQSVPHFSFKDGLLRYTQRVWVGQDEALHLKIMSALHDSAVGGHSRVPVTYSTIKKLFAWQGMKRDVHKFVQECLICQQDKPDKSRLPGLLQPLPIPSSAWQIVTMDFVEGLPRSGGFNCILVVVDSFSKYVHFLGLQHPFTTASVAKLFHAQVYRLHGMPSVIVTDRDKIFTSKLWKELFRLANVTLNMSSASTPKQMGSPKELINA